MFEFLKKIPHLFIYGKEFKVSATQILEYEKVKLSLDSIEAELKKDGPDTFYTFRGNEAELIERQLLPQHRWTNTNLSEKNFILPFAAAMFFLKGRTWDEIVSYECVCRYGMLHGKRRHLRIV